MTNWRFSTLRMLFHVVCPMLPCQAEMSRPRMRSWVSCADAKLGTSKAAAEEADTDSRHVERVRRGIGKISSALRGRLRHVERLADALSRGRGLWEPSGSCGSMKNPPATPVIYIATDQNAPKLRDFLSAPSLGAVFLELVRTYRA
jgi:hypothetical protein